MLDDACANDQVRVLGESRNVAGVLRVEHRRAAARVEPIDVEQPRVAHVHRDQQAIGMMRIVGLQLDPRVRIRREVDRFAAAVGIGGEEVEVLVAARVLQVENARAVGRPIGGADRPGRVRGDDAVVGVADRARPQREGAGVRRQVRDARAVG